MKALLFNFEVSDNFLQITDTLMQRILGIILCSNFLIVFIKFALKFISCIVFLCQACVKILSGSLLILHQLVFALV